jgi:hypothetical protein
VKYVAPIVLMLIVLVAGGLIVAHRLAYGNFPWDGGPDWVRWCERSYHRSAEDKNVDVDVQLQPIFRAPPLVGARFYASPPAICAQPPELLLYRSRGAGRYDAYALSGAPSQTALPELSSAYIQAVKSERNRVGGIALTVLPFGPHSHASVLVRPSIAAFKGQ